MLQSSFKGLLLLFLLEYGQCGADTLTRRKTAFKHSQNDTCSNDGSVVSFPNSSAETAWCTPHLYCVDGVCCDPGNPTSLCCPDAHPLCVGDGCCEVGYPKLCGQLFCCKADAYCCNRKGCCRDRDACCSDAPGSEQCCTDGQSCCGEGIGCAKPCSSIFDACGCYQTLQTYGGAGAFSDAGPEVFCGKTGTFLYRILREDEDCDIGLSPKDIRATKTVSAHVCCGGRKYFRSQFISTTSRLEVAEFYRDRFLEDTGKRLRIARIRKIDVLQFGRLYDLTVTANRVHYVKGKMARTFALASCEVVIFSERRVPCVIIADEADDATEGQLSLTTGSTATTAMYATPFPVTLAPSLNATTPTTQSASTSQRTTRPIATDNGGSSNSLTSSTRSSGRQRRHIHRGKRSRNV